MSNIQCPITNIESAEGGQVLNKSQARISKPQTKDGHRLHRLHGFLAAEVTENTENFSDTDLY
jgi:hypothetical protein